MFARSPPTSTTPSSARPELLHRVEMRLNLDFRSVERGFIVSDACADIRMGVKFGGWCKIGDVVQNRTGQDRTESDTETPGSGKKPSKNRLNDK